MTSLRQRKKHHMNIRLLFAAVALSFAVCAMPTHSQQDVGQPSSDEIESMIKQIGGLLEEVRAIDEKLLENQKARVAIDKNEKAPLVAEGEKFDIERNKVAKVYPGGIVVPIEEANRANVEIRRINRWGESIQRKANDLKAKYAANDRKKEDLLRSKSLLEGRLNATRRFLAR